MLSQHANEKRDLGNSNNKTLKQSTISPRQNEVNDRNLNNEERKINTKPNQTHHSREKQKSESHAKPKGEESSESSKKSEKLSNAENQNVKGNESNESSVQEEEKVSPTRDNFTNEGNVQSNKKDDEGEEETEKASPGEEEVDNQVGEGNAIMLTDRPNITKQIKENNGIKKDSPQQKNISKGKKDPLSETREKVTAVNEKRKVKTNKIAEEKTKPLALLDKVYGSPKKRKSSTNARKKLKRGKSSEHRKKTEKIIASKDQTAKSKRGASMGHSYTGGFAVTHEAKEIKGEASKKTEKQTITKKTTNELTHTSGLSKIQINTPVRDNNKLKKDPSEDKKNDVLFEKSHNLREQVFDLSDVLDRKTSEIETNQKKRKLRSQMIKKLEQPQKVTTDEALSGTQSDKDNDRSDSGIIEGAQVAFDGNFNYDKDNLTERGQNSGDDIIYYQKDDLTNYSRNRGLNKMKTRKLNQNDSENSQSEAELFAQIEKSLLHPYSDGRFYESDLEGGDRIKLRRAESVIAEEAKSDGSTEEIIKTLQEIRSKSDQRANPKGKMIKTTPQLPQHIMKRPTQIAYNKKKRKNALHKKNNVVKHDTQKFDKNSPYSEELVKRFKEYKPVEGVS